MLGAVKLRGEDTALAKQGFPFPVTRLGGAFRNGLLYGAVLFAAGLRNSQKIFVRDGKKQEKNSRAGVEKSAVVCYNIKKDRTVWREKR